MFFNRPGEIRDRGFDQQRDHASGLNLVTAVVVLWNAVYLKRVANALRDYSRDVDGALLQHLSPLGAYQPDQRLYLWRSELGPILWTDKLMVFYQLTRRTHETNTTPIIYVRV